MGANLPADEKPTVPGIEPIPYEAPCLTPIGSLHDLLAGSGTQHCDGMTFEAGPNPQVSPTPPFCS